MLNKKISQDSKVARLSVEATLLYTWCIPYQDINGRLYADVWSIKAIVPFVNEITIDKIPVLIQELVDNDLAIYYGDGLHKYIQLKGFATNQRVDPNKEATPEIPAPDQLQSNSRVTLPQVKESKGKVNGETNSPIQAVFKKEGADFDPIWESFPRKIGKKEAERHFQASIKKGFTVEQIQKAVDNYIQYLKDNKTEDKYIKHGSTFFNNWEDYLVYESKTRKERCDF